MGKLVFPCCTLRGHGQADACPWRPPRAGAGPSPVRPSARKHPPKSGYFQENAAITYSRLATTIGRTGLTTVFGMGTGVAPHVMSPRRVSYRPRTLCQEDAAANKHRVSGGRAESSLLRVDGAVLRPIQENVRGPFAPHRESRPNQNLHFVRRNRRVMRRAHRRGGSTLG